MSQNLCLAKHNISNEHIFLVFPKGMIGYFFHKPSCTKSWSNLHCFYVYDFAAYEATKPNTKQTTGIFFFLKQFSIN